MVTFKIENLDPLFIFNPQKMIAVMNDICALLSLADGPKLECNQSQSNTYQASQNDYNFKYHKTSQFDGLEIEFKLKTVFLLKLKNLDSSSVEIIINVKHPELEIKEILHLFEPYRKIQRPLNRPTDG